MKDNSPRNVSMVLRPHFIKSGPRAAGGGVDGERSISVEKRLK